MRNFESHTRENIDIVRDVNIFHCYSLLSAQNQRVAYKLASQENLGCTRDQPMPGPFPAPPNFWGKSTGDEVEFGTVGFNTCWMFDWSAPFSKTKLSNSEPQKGLTWDHKYYFSHNYTSLCECLDTQPIKITTRFSGSSDVSGRH